MEPSDKEQAKKKITEVKTFSVPFALGATNANISANNNPQISKKQIS